MTIRDDWRLDREIQSTDQRSQERMYSDRDMPFLSPEDRRDHERQIEERTGQWHIGGVAAGALAAAGLYVGLRHFPSKTLAQARRGIAEQLEKITERQGGDSILERLRRLFARSGPDAHQGAARGIVNPDLAHDIRVAQEIFNSSTGLVGNREGVVRAMLERYASRHPARAAEDLTQYPEQLINLARMPAFRETAGRMGLPIREVIGQLGEAAAEGPGIGHYLQRLADVRVPFTGWRPLRMMLPTELMTQGPALARIMPEHMPSYQALQRQVDLERARAGLPAYVPPSRYGGRHEPAGAAGPPHRPAPPAGAGGQPYRPDAPAGAGGGAYEAAEPAYNLGPRWTRHDPANVPEGIRQLELQMEEMRRFVEGSPGPRGIFVGGQIGQIRRVTVGRGREAVSFEVIPEEFEEAGLRLGRTGTGMAQGAAARMGVTYGRPIQEILAEQLPSGTRMYPELREPRTWWEKFQARALDVGYRTGVGPQYASRVPLGGRVRWLADVVKSAIYQKRIDLRPTAGEPIFHTLPENAWVRRQLHKVGLASHGDVRTFADLGWLDRLRLQWGFEPARWTRQIRAGRTSDEKHLIAQIMNEQGVPMRSRPPFSRKSLMQGEFYAFKSARQGLQDWMNYHINRPMWLFQEMTGMALRPGKTPMESLWRIGTRVALPAYMGYQALQYAEYKSRNIFGYGPISGAAQLYAEGRVLAQSSLDAAGVTDFAQSLEEKYPGMVESPGAKALFGGATTIGGTMLGHRVHGVKGGAYGLAAATAASLLFASGVTQEAQGLKEIYQGDREIPVHADRWWFLGRQPFDGGRIKYWRKHWLAEMQTDYKDKAIYGNRREAWRGSWLPTPENFFLLKNLYDPYYVENLHYYDRPYPTTSPMFEEVPIAGPVLGATVGRMLKPIRYREYEPAQNWGVPPEVTAGQQQAMMLGKPPVPLGRPVPITKWTMSQLTGETLHRLFDWTGLPGFLIGAVKENVTGRPGWMEQQTLLAASGSITSAERDFYDRNLGGLMGMTEFFRRFVPRKRRNQMYNPIENVAPEWLPGHRSVFPGDRAGYLDFHSGDPYTALEKGEGRLPGPGYEALHELHSGQPAVYDDYDRFKILSDIAPFSEAYRHYKRSVEDQINMGVLSGQDVDRYYRTLDNVQRRVKSKVSAYGNRYQTGAFAEDEVTVSRILGGTAFQVEEMPGVTFKLAGVKNRIPDMSESQREQYWRLKSRLRAAVGHKMHMEWGGAGVQTPAILEDLNREAIRGGLEAEHLSDLGYRAKHGGGGLPALYENLIHQQMPGPLDWPRVKWMGVRSPTEEYEQFQFYGTSNTNWSHPWKNYVMPWWHSTIKTPTDQVLRARQITGHADRLKYLKYQKLETEAMSAGNMQLAQQFHGLKKQTLIALQPSDRDYWSNIYRAVPAAERNYFPIFAGTSSEEEQERIIAAVPEYMRHHYIGLWRRKTPGGNFDSPILQRYVKNMESMARPDVSTQVAEYFGQYPMPPKDWMGWHPGVDMEVPIIKTANQEGIDIHQLGMWESQALQAEQMYPFVEPFEVESNVDWQARDDMLQALHEKGYTELQVDPAYSMDGDINFTIKRKRRSMIEAYNSPFYAPGYTGGTW